MLLLLRDVAGSATILGLFQFVALAPAFLLAPVTGAIIDRYPRRTVVVVADAARGVALVLGAAVVARPELRTSVVILGVATLLGVGHAFFVPAVQALVPSLVKPEDLDAANGARVAVNQGLNITGNAIGGALYALVGAPLLFLFNGITFLLSALAELWLPPDLPAARRDGGIWSDARAGLRRLVTAPPARRAMVAQVGVFALSPVLILATPFLVERFGGDAAAVGAVFAVSLLGGVAAFLTLSRQPPDGALRAVAPATGYLAIALAFAMIALARHLPVLALAAFLAGGGSGMVYLSVVTIIQRRFEPQWHGRLFAILEAGSSLVAPLAYVATGALLDAVAVGRWSALFAAYATASAVAGLALLGAERGDAKVV